MKKRKEDIRSDHKIKTTSEKKTSGSRAYALWLALICVLLYANTISNDYCLDDAIVITENKTTMKGLGGIGDHMKQDLFYGWLGFKSKTAASSGWRPLSLMTFSIETEFFGNGNAGIRHAVNLLIYLALTLCIFAWLSAFLLKNTLKAFLAALLFAVHPVHSEVVASIKGRDELLCMLLLLISVYLLWKNLKTPSAITYGFSIIFFFLSLTSKESSITFLAGIPVMLWYFTALRPKKIISLSSGFFAAAAAYLAIRHSLVPFTGLEANTDIINNAYLNASATEALATKLFALLIYVKLLVFPHPLIFDYSFNHIPYRDFSHPLVWISILLFAGMFYVASAGWKKKGYYSFCSLMFLVTISIASNLFLETGTMVAERLLFIPSLFFCMALGHAIFTFGQHAINKWRAGSLAAVWIVVPLVLAAAVKTVLRNADWKDDRSLFFSDIRHAPNSARVNNGAAGAYLFLLFEGENTQQESDSLASAALRHAKRAVEIYPEYMDAWINLGLAWEKSGQPVRAEESWEVVRKELPNHPKLAHINRVQAKRALKKGIELGRMQLHDSASYYYHRALTLATSDDSVRVACYYNLGGYYFNKGDYGTAHEMLSMGMAIDSNFSNIRVGFAETEKALRLFGPSTRGKEESVK